MCENMWVSILGWYIYDELPPLWCGRQSHLEWQTSSGVWTEHLGRRFLSWTSLWLEGGGCLWEAGRMISRESVEVTGEKGQGQWPSPTVVGVAMIWEEVETWWPWWMDMEVEGKSCAIKTYLHALAWRTEQWWCPPWGRELEKWTQKKGSGVDRCKSYEHHLSPLYVFWEYVNCLIEYV